MSNSSLVSYTLISPCRNEPRNHKIDTITIHCVVGQLSVEGICGCFRNSAVGASCNYAIGVDGRIGLCVEEKDRSWCSSSPDNDNRAITIECASDTVDPYAINDKVYKSLINLCVDICQRNGIKELKWKADQALVGQINKQNMTVHRWFANKACPGGYIFSRLGQIAKEVNARMGNKNAATPDKTVSVKYRVQTGAYTKKTNADSLVKNIKAAGFDAVVVQEAGMYKVQCGAFSKKANAEALAGELKRAGFDVFVRKV